MNYLFYNRQPLKVCLTCLMIINILVYSDYFVLYPKAANNIVFNMYFKATIYFQYY